jgi:hypothetical protein
VVWEPLFVFSSTEFSGLYVRKEPVTEFELVDQREQHRSLVTDSEFFLWMTSKGEEMTLRSRWMFGLLAVLVVLALTPSSFAQVNITITPNASAGEIQTNRAAQTATTGSSGAGVLVTGQLIANSPLTTTDLRLAYPGPITSVGTTCQSGSTQFACPTQNIPSADPIRIEGATGVFATVGPPRLNTASSRIEIQLPGFSSTIPNTQSGSFRLVGVRIDANGQTAPVNVSASLADQTANYLLTTTSAAVINALGPGIASMQIGSRTGQPNQGTATIFTNRTVPDQTASFTITEGFANAFRSTLQESNSGVALNPTPPYNSTRIRLTFGNVPTGVTMTLSINFPSSTTGNPNASFTSGGSTASITSTTPTATIEILGSSLTTTENLEVDISGLTVSSTAAVTTPGSITVTSTLFPNCDTILDDVGLPSTSAGNGYPCFAQADNGPITVVNIVPTNTTLLIPYAAVLSPFDTGLAISNTSADPFGSAGGGAAPSAGTIRLDFFPTLSTGGAGTPFSLTTSATVRPGAGLSSDGTLAAGATWTVLLSQALTAAGQTGNFIGYLFVQANFLNAHGAATISDFRTYSLSSNVLVLLPPATSPRSAPVGGAESLAF